MEFVNGYPVTTIQAIWVHEFAACLAMFVGLLLLLSKKFSGHVTVLTDKQPKTPRPTWHKSVAIFMLYLGSVYLIVSGVWILDLLFMDLNRDIDLFRRDEAPMFNLYSI